MELGAGDSAIARKSSTLASGQALTLTVTVEPRRRYFCRRVWLTVLALVLTWLSTCSLVLPYWLRIDNVGQINDLLYNERQLNHMPSATHKAHARVSKGLELMRNSTVCFVGCIRNGESSLPSVLEQVDRLMELFHESCAIFVEGDSIDNTLSILRRWAAHSPQRRTAISYSTDSIADPNNDYSKEKGRLPREGRIAVSRNKALETLRGFAKQPDYVIVLDLDIHGVDPLGIADSFGRTTKWDVICANGVTLHGIYRDIYAFRRHDIYTNHHVVFDHSLPEQRAFVQQNRTKFYDIMSTFTRSDGENLMQVDSCFGGLAIYRAEALQDCSYAFRWNDTQKVDCEHVLFHHCLVEQNNATIYHNPIMKLWYGSALVKFGFLRA